MDEQQRAKLANIDACEEDLRAKRAAIKARDEEERQARVAARARGEGLLSPKALTKEKLCGVMGLPSPTVPVTVQAPNEARDDRRRGRRGREPREERQREEAVAPPRRKPAVAGDKAITRKRKKEPARFVQFSDNFGENLT